MQKNVLIGIIAGLMVLVGFLGWTLYAERLQGPVVSDGGQQRMTAPTEPKPIESKSTEPRPPASASTEQMAPVSSLTPEERDRLRAQVQKKLAEIQAKGPSATPRETLGLINDAEKLGGENFDPRYFQGVRGILEKSAKVQDLNTELTRIKDSKSARDIARSQEILAELRQLSEALANDAALLQKYPPKSPGAATP